MNADDEKRLEVADRMRRYDVSGFKESAIAPFLECLGRGYTDWRGVLDELADLIDRPTCQIRLVIGSDGVSPIVNYDGRFLYECTNCRCQAFLSHEAAAQIGERRKYCSNCGAEVVEND